MYIKNMRCLYLQVQVTFVVLVLCDCTYSQEPDGILEVNFAENPASPGDDVVLRCKVYGEIETDLVGISRYNNNGVNTIIFRNGDLLEDAPDGKFSMEILPDTTDGSINYHVTVSNIDYTSDGGLYTCYVLTVEGFVQGIVTSRLDVTEEHLLPMCESSKTGMTFTDQSTITLTCMAKDSSATTQWMRDDQIDVPEDQITIRNGDTVVTSLSHEVSYLDEGVSFTCHVVNGNQRIDGSRYCSIGPIKVTNSTVEVRKIAGLSVAVFAVVVTIACILFIICVILLILFCRKVGLCHGSPLKRASHLSSKSYSMRGKLGSFTDSTLSRGGTVTGGRETFSYHPSRPAPPPPAALTTSQQNGSARPVSTVSSELSNAEALLMATLLKKGKKNEPNRPDSVGSTNRRFSDEIIYANTDQLNILDPIIEDSDFKGVDNPGYDGYNAQPIELSPRKPPPVNQSDEIYSNTSYTESQSSDWDDSNSPGGAGTGQSSQIYGNVQIGNSEPDHPIDPIMKPITSNRFPAAPSKPVPMPGLAPAKNGSSPLPKPFQLPALNASNDTPKPVPLVKPRKKVSSSSSIDSVPSTQTRPSAPTKPVKTPSIDLDGPLPTPPVSPSTDLKKQLPSSPKRSSLNLEAPLPNPPIVPAPPPKPKYDIMSETENKPSPPLKPTHNIDRPAPPTKPSYNIMSETDNRPAPPQKPAYNIMSERENRPAPPQRPSYNIMSESGSRPSPPQKPSYNVMSETDNRPTPPQKPSYNIMSDSRLTPSSKPTHDLMSDSRPTPPSKPTHDLMSASKPSTPPKPVPKPRTNSGGSKPPPPPKKPTYDI